MYRTSFSFTVSLSVHLPDDSDVCVSWLLVFLITRSSSPQVYLHSCSTCSCCISMHSLLLNIAPAFEIRSFRILLNAHTPPHPTHTTPTHLTKPSCTPLHAHHPHLRVHFPSPSPSPYPVHTPPHPSSFTLDILPSRTSHSPTHQFTHPSRTSHTPNNIPSFIHLYASPNNSHTPLRPTPTHPHSPSHTRTLLS